MKPDTATKIAALVAELGKMRDEIDSEPDASAGRIMRNICSPKQARDAMHLALGVTVETTERMAEPLVDQMLLCAAILAPLHQNNVNGHVVSRGEVLRMLADAADASDRLKDRLKGLLEKLFDDRVELESSKPTDSGDKPGSN